METQVKPLIAPSVLNSDLSQLYCESQKLIDNGADFLHLDVMDGHFVPNLTFGHPVIKCLRSKMKDVYFEAHMMVSKPQDWIEGMSDANVDQYTFHIEPVFSDVPDICRKIKESGMKVGLAIKPNTTVEELDKYIDMADAILIMTVEPGFGGQKFMSNMMPKVKWLREKYPNLNIEVDGGVSLDTVEECSKAGANVMVAGTAIINSNNQRQTIDKMREKIINNLKLGIY